MRVLIADDNAQMVLHLTAMLQKDFEVVASVRDGVSLVEEALRLKPDVIVTDISMPRLNGIEAVRRIRTGGLNAKIIFVTMHQEREILEACLGIGALAIVAKSRLDADLVSAIKLALKGHEFISSEVQS